MKFANRKVDLIDEQKIHPRVKKVLKKYSLQHYFVSAKTGEGIDNLYFQTVKLADDVGYINNFNMNGRETIMDHSKKNLNMKKKKKESKCC